MELMRIRATIRATGETATVTGQGTVEKTGKEIRVFDKDGALIQTFDSEQVDVFAAGLAASD